MKDYKIMDLGLQNKKILISGGSKGIGLAIAQKFIDEGAFVSICARNDQGIDKALENLGDRAIGMAVDISKRDEVEQWIKESHRKMEGLDHVVANVSALASGHDLQTWKKAINTDLLGTVVLVNGVLPYLTRQKSGSIVIISSISAFEIDVFAEPYGALKASLNHYGKSVALRVAEYNVRVNLVSPGTVYFKGGIWNHIECEQPDLYQTALKNNPLGRMGTPEDIASSVVFLTSQQASFITGTNLVVDGGMTKRV